MKQSIKNTIYLSIIQNKWMDISYLNKNNEVTNYFIGVKDIDIKKEIVYCDIFNPYKKLLKDKKEMFIYINSIKSIEIIEESYYEVPSTILNKFKKDDELKTYLEVINFDNNILKYLSDCYRYDNDPFLKDIVMIDGIDLHTLSITNKYKLDDKQFETILDKVFKKKKKDAEAIIRFQTLAINVFSIDINDKQYVVAYRTLNLNFKNKTLKIGEKSLINKSFLISEEKKVTLGMYLDINPEVFISTFDAHKDEYIEGIKANFHNYELVNTRPTIFLLARTAYKDVDITFETIHQMDKDNKLTFPLRAFFGRTRPSKGVSKEVNIVIFDQKKINIDQMRVIYNSMVNHVTYVKGPPGTGKTETIFNVLLSAYANDMTVLVCSNNNHPVSDIYVKMLNSLTVKFENQEKPIPIVFPLIRLGNNIEMVETIARLKSVLIYIQEHVKVNISENATAGSKKRSMATFNKLKETLVQYENTIDLTERLNILNKIKSMSEISAINDKLDEQINSYRALLDEAKIVSDDEAMSLAISASNDRNFQYYLYYSSLAKYKKLLTEPYKELVDIINLSDVDEAVMEFNRYLRNDDNLKKFLHVFPLVLCTNLSCGKLGSPKPQFNLVVMDEAGQCNIASSLIPIIRGNNLLLVGDTNQLQPVTVLEDNVNESLKERYEIGDEYDYIHNSILSTMMRKDNNSKNILLRYHYRCGKKIANFVNKRFYNDQLKLLNQNVGELVYYNVKNTVNKDNRNAYKEETLQIARLIKSKNYQEVGIITPFVNQAALINQYLLEFGINDVKAGTIHTLQGSEKQIIIMSSAISLKTGLKTMDWIKNNHELINVAVTRAKNKFIFVGDKQAIDLLSKDEDNDIKILSDYIYSNGTVIVPPSDAIISYDFSNDSKNEKDFFETVKPYFNRRGSNFKIERNVPVINAIKKINAEDFHLIGKKEFDLIVQVSSGLFNKQYHTIVVFEIDGGEHIGSNKQAELDRQKEKVCKKYGIKLIRIPNSAVKDYETIISLFEMVVKGLKDIDQAFSQLSLFDNETD